MQEQNNPTKILLNAIGEMVLMVKPTGEIIECNSLAKQFYHQHQNKIGSILGQNILNHPKQLFSSQGKNKFKLCAQIHKPVQTIEIKKDKYTCFSMYPTYNPNLKDQYIVIVGTDITDQVEMQKQYIAIQQNLNNTLNAIEEGLCITDSKGFIILANQAFTSFLTHKKTNPEGLLICDVLSGFANKHADCLFHQSLDQAKRQEKTYQNEEKSVQINCNPIFNGKGLKSSQISGAILVFEDVTEDVLNTEKIKQKDLALSEIIDKTNDRIESFKQQVQQNLQEIVFPTLAVLEKLEPSQSLLKVLRSNLESVSGEFRQKLKVENLNLTQREINICNFIRSGMSTKEIAQTLNTSPLTVQKQRKIIRKKLKLAPSINFETYLHQLEH